MAGWLGAADSAAPRRLCRDRTAIVRDQPAARLAVSRRQWPSATQALPGFFNSAAFLCYPGRWPADLSRRLISRSTRGLAEEFIEAHQATLPKVAATAITWRRSASTWTGQRL